MAIAIGELISAADINAVNASKILYVIPTVRISRSKNIAESSKSTSWDSGWIKFWIRNSEVNNFYSGLTLDNEGDGDIDASVTVRDSDATVLLSKSYDAGSDGSGTKNDYLSLTPGWYEVRQILSVKTGGIGTAGVWFAEARSITHPATVGLVAGDRVAIFETDYSDTLSQEITVAKANAGLLTKADFEGGT